MNRNYKTPTVSREWANSRGTDMAVAVAIHAIADATRTPEDIWDAPTKAEWDHVHMAVEEYVRNGDYSLDIDGFDWGCEKVRI